ncbi:MAG: selenocysteine-specific translation elongation factor [Candidatus Solincola sediminis]|uniref:Selenocysteine-specific elongation factor n=1 Tax=Candidatus Solincola sediminis TaxID=1797199 RepID=A0A1F2WEX6_9ACTN|nr:MAG: selenocysteine-specific translation elongation factor [Candidatus Solincola sediminis]OFW59139.1 MAG: selenocysteine-specific translation elongation factor [Candidatus Solincola sediminis]
MKSFIIGTAGHIDHGKTELIKALTGIDTDRLKEEKERGISIELGFAELDLPGGITAGIVDVPGHEHFIKNMLAGASGFDMVLLTVAADDSVMPQTIEHLAIMDLLDVREGVVVVTKADLAEEDMLELVKEDIAETLQGTALEDAETVVTSSRTGQGLDELRQAISRVAERVRSRDSEGSFRLPVDRVFSLKGIGTVVTGTLWEGSVADGDEAVIQPGGRKVRVRNIQVHGEDVDRARAGQRVALNLPGISKQEIERGDVIGSMPFLHPSLMLDAHLRLLATARPLKNRARIRFHHGTREVMARVILLGGREEMAPGEEAYVQYRLESPIVALYHDRYILRSYSPMTTIGGGVILNSRPKKHRHHQPAIIESLQRRRRGDARELTLLAVDENKWPLTRPQLLSLTEIKESELDGAVSDLLSSGRMLPLKGEGQDYYVSPSLLEVLLGQLVELTGELHAANSLKPGVDKELLRQRMGEDLSPEILEVLLKSAIARGEIEIEAGRVRLPGGGRSLSGSELAAKDGLRKAIVEGEFNPPLFKELIQASGMDKNRLRDLLNILMEEGEIEQVNPEFFLAKGRLAQAEERIKSFLTDKETLGVSDLRDMLGASRKYSIPLLEYFDRKRVTRREGDYRVAY